MIVVRFSGGLGNQMYQYVLLKKLQQDYQNVRVCADITDYIGKNYHQGFEIESIFENIKLNTINIGQIFMITGRLPIFYGGPYKEVIRRLRKTINRRFFYKRNGNVIMGADFIKRYYCGEYNVRMKDDALYTYIDKFYPPFDFFDEFDIQKVDYKFIPFEDAQNEKIAYEIENCMSISIHVRRGDYVGTAFDQLTRQYYINAIKFIQSKRENVHFFIFSDDKPYVAEMFEFLENKTIVTNNWGSTSFRDMQLMSLCKGNIVANSTFSMWGALLNKNKEKIVVYPILSSNGSDSPFLMYENWYGINNF